MNCDEVRELGAAYALRALDPDEQQAVEAHLQECELHAELAALRAAAHAMSITAPALDPPPDLRERILRGVAASAPAPAPLPQRQPAARGIRAPYALAAALALLAAGLGAWVVVLLGDGGTEAVVRQVSAGAIEARLVYLPEEGTASLTVGGLAPLEPEQTYQLWVIRDGEPGTVGLFDASASGTAGVSFRRELRAGDVVAVTVEPAGGSPQPTSDPIFAAEI